MIVVHCSGSRCDFTTVFRASVPSWVIAICPAFRKPVRVLMPRSSSTCWMLPDSLPLRGLFMSRNPLILFYKLGRIQSGCALFLCRHISFTQHSTFTSQHSPLNYPNTTLAGTPRLWYMFLATSKLIARRPWRISLNAVVDTPIAFAASFCL